MICSRIAGIYRLTDTRINDTIIRVNCRSLYFGWNNGRQEQVTYLKVSFGIRLGQAKSSFGQAE
jgi:hypothetical protein